MKLQTQIKITTRTKKRVGRGLGSGRGKTSGRGTKGQKARGKVNPFLSLAYIYKKIPYKRGFRNSKISPKALPVKLDQLAVFEKNETVDIESLISKGLIKEDQAKKRGVKVVGEGKIDLPLTVKIPATGSAKSAIEKVGGKVVCE